MHFNMYLNIQLNVYNIYSDAILFHYQIFHPHFTYIFHFYFTTQYFPHLILLAYHNLPHLNLTFIVFFISFFLFWFMTFSNFIIWLDFFDLIKEWYGH